MWDLDHKQAEHWRINAFELWCWRRLLRVPWTVRRSNQSILKEISPEYSLGGLMLKLNLPYFGHLMWRSDSFEKTLMLGEIEGRKRRGWQRMRLLDGNSMDMSFSKLLELVLDREAWHAVVYGVTKRRIWPSGWTDWLTTVTSGSDICSLRLFLHPNLEAWISSWSQRVRRDSVTELNWAENWLIFFNDKFLLKFIFMPKRRETI